CTSVNRYSGYRDW
nr:immunoglobulin heavy chain junction region [Macaca mulatta]MOY21896.1 immunoglobulin heavy chain junction region [Macaca mulatta]MOY22388.1 immunoglobulin heavy chain junction region [Macaca mulatta]MOY22707.1 immunoglobulin heavy chain junction region [Macaca mulatta]MOY23114.1 immunoglobulin heavy chain junction region [Macaca mulatta]